MERWANKLEAALKEVLPPEAPIRNQDLDLRSGFVLVSWKGVYQLCVFHNSEGQTIHEKTQDMFCLEIWNGRDKCWEHLTSTPSFDEIVSATLTYLLCGEQ